MVFGKSYNFSSTRSISVPPISCGYKSLFVLNGRCMYNNNILCTLYIRYLCEVCSPTQKYYYYYYFFFLIVAVNGVVFIINNASVRPRCCRNKPAPTCHKTSSHPQFGGQTMRAVLEKRITEQYKYIAQDVRFSFFFFVSTRITI